MSRTYVQICRLFVVGFVDEERDHEQLKENTFKFYVRGWAPIWGKMIHIIIIIILKYTSIVDKVTDIKILNYLYWKNKVKLSLWNHIDPRKFGCDIFHESHCLQFGVLMHLLSTKYDICIY